MLKWRQEFGKLSNSTSSDAACASRIRRYKARADWAMLNYLRALKANELTAFDLLGWFQSDGTFSFEYWGLYFAPKDMQYYNYLKEIGTHYMGWTPNELTKYSKTCSIEALEWYSKFLWPLGRILRRPELPSFLWAATDECKIHFLRWYDQGDGTKPRKDYHKHQLWTSEPARVIGLSNLARSTGLWSEYIIKDAVTPAGKPTKKCWARVSFKDPFEFNE